MKKVILILAFLLPILASAQGLPPKQMRSTGEPLGRVIVSNGSGICMFGNIVDSLKLEENVLSVWTGGQSAAKTVDLSSLTGDTDTKQVLVSANDATEGYLENKIIVSSGTNTSAILEITTLNDGSDEDLQIQIDISKINIPASQVSDFDTEVANNPAVAANTAKTSFPGFGTLLGDYGFSEADPVYSAWDKDYNDLTNKPTIPTDNSQLTNGAGYITSPNDADADPANELQVLSISNDTIYLSDGGFVVLPPSVADSMSFFVVSDTASAAFTQVEYGYLYNWYTVIDVREIANTGWHVPTKAEYVTLTTYLGGGNYSAGLTYGGGYLKQAGYDYWNEPNTEAVNSYGFNARGGGMRANTSSFSQLKQESHYWTSDPYDGYYYRTSLAYNNGNFFGTSSSTTPLWGYSIRLLKNSTTLSSGETGIYVGNDGKIYPTICIGTQEFLAADLVETKYRNGDPIPEVTDNTAWAALSTGARCSYNNDETLAFSSVASGTAVNEVTDKDTLWFDGVTIAGTGKKDDKLRVNADSLNLNINVNDADADPTNELQIISMSNDTIYLSNGGFVKLPAETDPVYSAWNKSTGISIPSSQVSDFDTEVANNAAVAANTAKTSFPGFGTLLGDYGFTESDPVFTAWDKDYNDLINKPTIPTVNDATITISGTAVESSPQTFTLNQPTNKEIVINGDGVGTDDQTASEVTVVVQNGIEQNNVQLELEAIRADMATGGDGWGTDVVVSDVSLGGDGTSGSPLTVVDAQITIAASQVSDFDTEVANNTAVAANTAKVSNATHTGEVTGADALTVADNVIDYANIAATLKQEITDNDGAFDWSAAGQINCSISTATTFSFSNISVNKNIKIKLVISSSATVTWNTAPLDLRGDAISGDGTYLINLEAWGTTEGDIAGTVRKL